MVDESEQTTPRILYNHVKHVPVFTGTHEQQLVQMEEWRNMGKAGQREIRRDPARAAPQTRQRMSPPQRPK